MPFGYSCPEDSKRNTKWAPSPSWSFVVVKGEARQEQQKICTHNQIGNKESCCSWEIRNSKRSIMLAKNAAVLHQAFVR